VPGEPLGDHVLHFDHAPGSDRDDKFEINSAGYRLRKSACFQQSEMTCVTCHDPHDAPRGEEAVKRYTAICQSCHTDVHPRGAPRVAGATANATCIDCHMPKRRAEDAVHVVMTDHLIQRARPSRNLIAARTEAHSSAAYRGEVVPYYPPALAASPENELYLAVAQVQDGSNLAAGIPRLQQAIERHRPARADFYYELARAYATSRDPAAVMRWCREALQRDPAFVPALKELAAAAVMLEQYAEAARALEDAVTRRPADATALADLGHVYLRQQRNDEAHGTLERALALDASLPRAHNLIGLSALRRGYSMEADRHFREAIRLQPDLAEAHNNLGNLLAGQRAYDQAGFHFAQAIASDPNYVEAHHSYGLVLGLTKAYPRAVAELETAIRLAPDLLTAHLDLAEVLVSMGRRGAARPHFEAAARSPDADVRAAAVAGLQGLP
jgi:predicted CXXCH cytochrome family protein